MTLMVRSVPAALVLSLAACATSPPPPPATAATPASAGAAKAAAVEDPDELICEYEPVTGTHFRKKVCLTRQQRADLRESGQDFVGRRPRLDPSSAD
jgi:hypothetical protein